jgi:hypothetical protein
MTGNSSFSVFKFMQIRLAFEKWNYIFLLIAQKLPGRKRMDVERVTIDIFSAFR